MRTNTELDYDGVPLADGHHLATEVTVGTIIFDEELNELKEAVCFMMHSTYKAKEAAGTTGHAEQIAEEAADTVTAITTLCEAIGIDANMRSDAVETVNMKNRARGRL